MSTLDDYVVFQERISNIRSVGELTTFSGKAYRSTSPKYATENDLITGDGSKLYGGRWNPIGIAAVYASLTIETAFQEALSQVRYFGMPVEQALPRTFCGLELSLIDVLDLRIGNIRSRLRFSREDMINSDWRKIVSAGKIPRTQSLGHAVYSLNLQAILVPSGVSKTAANIVVFPDNLNTSSHVEILGGQ